MLIAYYCFINLGMLPKTYENLDYENKRLVRCFVLKDLLKREKQNKELGR